MSEADFHDLVAAWLLESFVEIEHEPRVYKDDGGYLIPDFVVHDAFNSYVIEVEDSADDLADPIGQCGLYAAVTGYRPVAVFPADDAPDFDLIPDWMEAETV